MDFPTITEHNIIVLATSAEYCLGIQRILKGLFIEFYQESNSEFAHVQTDFVSLSNTD